MTPTIAADVCAAICSVKIDGAYRKLQQIPPETRNRQATVLKYVFSEVKSVALTLLNIYFNSGAEQSGAKRTVECRRPQSMQERCGAGCASALPRLPPTQLNAHHVYNQVKLG